MSCFCTTWLWTDNLYWLMNFDVTQVMHTKMKDTDLMPQVAIWTFYIEKRKKRQNGHTWSIPLPLRNCSVKINLKVESREKSLRLYTIPLHFIRGCFQHCWLANFEFKKIFLLQSHVVMKKGEPICKMNLIIVSNLISYF